LKIKQDERSRGFYENVGDILSVAADSYSLWPIIPKITDLMDGWNEERASKCARTKEFITSG
jgi:hypothetical protein